MTTSSFAITAQVAVHGPAAADKQVPAVLRRRIDEFSANAYAAVAAMGENEDLRRTGIFVANTLAGWGYGEPQLQALVAKGPEAVAVYQATAWFPAAAQGEVTIARGYRGCAKTYSGERSALGEAFWAAAEELRAGTLDVVYVGAAESATSEFAATHSPQVRRRRDNGAAFFRLRGLASATASLGAVDGWSIGWQEPDEDSSGSLPGRTPLAIAGDLADGLQRNNREKYWLGGGFVLCPEVVKL
ncbi:hypothetical protein [Amycolatopsis sp. WGS_07]|uniref:hypothetical protein n=1 Tax=Amycolatopsis sp. WGS_07 TaxID=3076764 RepID=UPI00387333B5